MVENTELNISEGTFLFSGPNTDSELIIARKKLPIQELGEIKGGFQRVKVEVEDKSGKKATEVYYRSVPEDTNSEKET